MVNFQKVLFTSALLVSTCSSEREPRSNSVISEKEDCTAPYKPVPLSLFGDDSYTLSPQPPDQNVWNICENLDDEERVILKNLCRVIENHLHQSGPVKDLVYDTVWTQKAANLLAYKLNCP